MNRDIRAIDSYIRYLRQDCGLMVTLHPMTSEPIIGEYFSAYNVHFCRYCLQLKADHTLWEHCVHKQANVWERVKEGEFVGVCHAGVLEFVYPIRSNNDIIGVISVSGYRTENGTSYVSRLAKKYNLNYDTVMSSYRTHLSAKVPDKSEIDTLLHPLCMMLELAYSHVEKPAENNDVFSDILHFVNINATTELSLPLLAAHFSYSPSYVSHAFRKHTGKTFSEYLTERRVHDAAALLKNTDGSVTEIAFACGFNDGNYFSKVFKKQLGISPRQYRKSK